MTDPAVLDRLRDATLQARLAGQARRIARAFRYLDRAARELATTDVDEGTRPTDRVLTSPWRHIDRILGEGG